MKFWKKLSEEKPHCYQSGGWEGLKSEQLLVRDSEGVSHTGVCYQGILDGSEFCDFYDNRDFEIKDVEYWAEIPSPYLEK